MMRKFVAVLWLVALAGAWFGVTASTAVAAAPTGFAADFRGPNKGTLFSIDLTTGAPTAIGPLGQDDISGLSFACDGTLYGINRKDNGDRQPNQLVTINTTTGASSVVGPLDVEPADSGLTFGADGKLYMTNVNTGSWYQIDIASAAVTEIGPVGEGIEITGLATRADGTIFGYDRTNTQLVTVDPATGAATIVGPSSDLNLTGLDFDSTGTLWGVSDKGSIVRFDTTTGAATQAGTYDTKQFSFQSLAIGPEGCAPPATTTTSTSTTLPASSAPSAPASSSTAAKSSSSSSVPIVLAVIALIAIVAIALFLVSRRRRDDDAQPQ
jgi:streptogramin lyase